MGRVAAAAVPDTVSAADLRRLYRRLRSHYGPQRWWPAGTELEMIIGALLVQNTAWTSARRALDALIDRGKLDVAEILHTPEAELAELIRPSGYYKSKARKLKAFAQLVAEEGDGDVHVLLAKPLPELRPLLLATHGFGPETADSVCLFAARQPTFMVDAYTRRILDRLDWLRHEPRYEELRALFMAALPGDTALYAEYHALLVTHAKRTCRKRPRCPDCPLLDLCPTGRAEVGLRPAAAAAPAAIDWSDPCPA